MNKPILVIGSLNMDLVATAERLPRRGETVFGQTFNTFPGGKGANQAVAAAKLGASVKMVGCAGQDSFAEEILQSLAAINIDTSLIRRTAGPTGIASINVGTTGVNTIRKHYCCSPGRQ